MVLRRGAISLVIEWLIDTPVIVLINLSRTCPILLLISFLLHLSTQGAPCVCQRMLVCKATSTTSSIKEPILTINGVTHRKDLDIRNRGHYTGDLGMLNLEGDICDHGILATTAMSARTRLVATPVFGEVYPPTL